ncbi:uncharacterized protein MONOS_2548 [Monocercomonoides exilis]|uniref:uncharacterized protein n=1 Tax=Monocercomonoides exilis TaxID=2049356 RepID=UPI0035595899|nr:hypothetical protein MONOS_2548 [Monocercomonoides exilis]|eukprot:MONOS_2548.1-p1 / transcript=MONOS_2548.1 / gene=MONOS_2548 / organism=Monocercomonoides_exilis_PA203 / gene_product=unspecified product / transcript_product=unspecified product / location=Mono_scaffold00053:106269-106913(+) / protein_length=215 / sequence_SO=supercontig / SO=protein_coding / is_pseudo=false
MARAETVREPWVCWKRADEADGSGEEDVDDDDKDENEENDDVDCDDCECEFCGWGMPLEATVVASVPFPVIFVLGARKESVCTGVKVEMRREREESLKGAMHPRAYSIVAHGLCCVLPQASTSLPLLATILSWLMMGSQLLYTELSAVPAFHTLFDGIVEPHCWNGERAIVLSLKNTSFPLPLVALLPSKKQKKMNFVPLIQSYVLVQHNAAPP